MFLIPQDFWEVKEVQGKGKGVFAKKEISAGTVIGDYLGKVIPIEREGDYDSGEHFYSMYYSDEALIFPDVQTPDIHLFNHSCTPNCWMYTYRGHTLYFAIRRIFTGEELTVSYLLSPQDKYCKPCTHLCNCGGVFCFQTMHLSEKRYAQWNVVHEKEEQETPAEKAEFDKQLPKSSSYPENILDNPIYVLFGSQTADAKVLPDDKVPSVAQLRKLLRESGRTLKFSKINLRVLGILDNLIISDQV